MKKKLSISSPREEKKMERVETIDHIREQLSINLRLVTVISSDTKDIDLNYIAVFP